MGSRPERHLTFVSLTPPSSLLPLTSVVIHPTTPFLPPITVYLHLPTLQPTRQLHRVHSFPTSSSSNFFSNGYEWSNNAFGILFLFPGLLEIPVLLNPAILMYSFVNLDKLFLLVMGMLMVMTVSDDTQ